MYNNKQCYLRCKKFLVVSLNGAEESQPARARFHVVANKYVEVVLAFGSGKRRGKLQIAAPIKGGE